MKFSFIRHFKIVLDNLKESDCSFYTEFLAMLKSGIIPFSPDKLGKFQELAGCSGKPVDFYRKAAESCPDFVSVEYHEYRDTSGDVMFDIGYIVLSKAAYEILPKYIPELAR